RRLGERRMLVTGTTTLIVAYLLLAAAGNLWVLSATLALVAFGTGLNWPTLSSLASQYTDSGMQGAILGVMQSLAALGRTLGAVWAGWAFGTWVPATPFVLCAVIMSLAATVALLFMIKAPAPAQVRSEPAVGVSV
ncbi:MAG: MFS transporter, partial [Gemmatimonadetes bacterium]|nr:MFS transporter [Gemmatimonadota bacterium]NIS03039.1 MFS transporter [Gemmatimonadota bacterium]NIT68764.1 MFS transporter [Gemmatimonadota bacterium]NIU53412.1 MFS transporter [Gemmatimonadota bacterium]NIW77486.1 MFS transporter [Gemmatimonadota bacterium]